MRAQAWPAGPTAAWPDEGPTTSPPRSAWETPEAADHPTPLTSPNASTPSSASPSRRSSSSLASEARLASMAARAAHLMDDVDRLRASNLEVPRLRRECEELRAAAARADGAPFFVAAGLKKPHLPFYYPSELDALYPPAEQIAPPRQRFPPKGMP